MQQEKWKWNFPAAKICLYRAKLSFNLPSMWLFKNLLDEVHFTSYLYLFVLISEFSHNHWTARFIKPIWKEYIWQLLLIPILTVIFPLPVSSCTWLEIWRHLIFTTLNISFISLKIRLVFHRKQTQIII